MFDSCNVNVEIFVSNFGLKGGSEDEGISKHFCL